MYRNLLKFVQQRSCKRFLYFHLFQRTSSNFKHHQVFPPDSRTEKFSSLLESYGFNHDQINGILQSSYSVLNYSKEDLLSNLKIWLSFEVNDKLCTILSTYPELLTLSPEHVSNRVKELMTLFTKKDINKLLVTCPCVYIDDFSTIYEKVEYIVHMMGVEQKSIVKSRALQYDLYYIKCRHIFITRAGCYVVSKRMQRNQNPPLHKIFSRSIKTFVKLTGLTEEEYNAFCLIYKDELLEEENSDDELDF